MTKGYIHDGQKPYLLYSTLLNLKHAGVYVEKKVGNEVSEKYSFVSHTLKSVNQIKKSQLIANINQRIVVVENRFYVIRLVVKVHFNLL